MGSVSDFTFHEISGVPSQEIESEVVKVWVENAGLGHAEAKRRLAELVVVARDQGSRVVGITTASIVEVGFLNRNNLYQLRYFIHQSVGVPGLDVMLTKQAVAELEKRAASSPLRVIGVLAVIQNDRLASLEILRRPVLMHVPFVFIGFTKEGYQTRVYYFNGARI